MFFHPHPGDFDALKSYACAHQRENELVEIGYVVGMEWSKHQRKAYVCYLFEFWYPSTDEISELVSKAKLLVKYMSIFAKSISRCSRCHCFLIDCSYRDDYYTPSTSLFRSFVQEEVVARYGVESLIEQGTVVSLVFSDDKQLFEVHTADGRVFFSKAVVMAIGPGAIPNVPKLLQDFEGSSDCVYGEGWCHTSAFLDKTFRLRAGDNGVLLLIGGG